MRPARIAALVAGCLAVLPGVGMLAGGGALGIASIVARDDQGYFDATIDRIETDAVAVVSDEVTFTAEPGSPDWLMDRLDIDLRLRVTSTSEQPVFVGIARTAQVDGYLGGLAHDRIVELDDGFAPVYERVDGDLAAAAPPTGEEIWVASATGTGEQELTWEAEGGRWTAVVMNADGTPGLAVDVNVGVDPGFVVPLAITLLVAGAILTAIAVALVVYGARRDRDAPDADGDEPGRGFPGTPLMAPPIGFPAPPEPQPIGAPAARTPVRVEARLDPGLSRWQWLVKWFLAIPHFVVLAFLWVAFVVTTVVAFFSILFTKRYPEGIFDFNRGVLRWSWRVQYYATTGGLGTDRYPPFSLGRHPEYPAVLDIERPGELSRGLVLVKWWLLALPHLLLLGALTANVGWVTDGGTQMGGMSVLGLLVLFAAVALLFTGRYPRSMFDLVVGINRWAYRVIAYVALMTDDYPPFRLDQGGSEPGPTEPRSPTPPTPATPAEIDAREHAHV
jgi:hypothetical protein